MKQVLALSSLANLLCQALARDPLPHASDFLVDGSKIPGISDQVGDIGDSYAGLLRIGDDAALDNSLYFWMFPLAKGATQDSDDLIIWLNGGPACSSLLGAMAENGPISLTSNKAFETIAKLRGKYAWNNLADILYVESPAGTGFTRGAWTTNVDENGAANDFVGFLQNYFKVFPEQGKKKLYLWGESYGSKYVTYISDYLHDAGIYVSGAGIVDGTFLDFAAEGGPAQVPYNTKMADKIGLNKTDVDLIARLSAESGFDEQWFKDAYSFPPKGYLRWPDKFNVSDYSISNAAFKAALDKNPCFNTYHIVDECPLAWDPMIGSPNNITMYAQNVITKIDNFVNLQKGFKEAINAPPSVVWLECMTQSYVFPPQGDLSGTLAVDDYFGKVITNVTEKGGKFVIAHGLLDALIPWPTPVWAIQNTTWNGKLGFQTEPVDDLYIDGQREGTIHEERGLTYALIDECGHQCPKYRPAAMYQLVEYMMGRKTLEQLKGR